MAAAAAFTPHLGWPLSVFATPDAVAKVDPAKAPPGIDVRALLSETHDALYKPKA